MKLKNPGVYIQEVPRLPPPVAEVPSAVPAFIGYTAKATKLAANDLHLVPTKIASLFGYQQYFGEHLESIELLISDAGNGEYAVGSITPASPNYFLYYSIKMFFDNGGGDCYVVSVGVPPAPVAKSDLLKGLDTLRGQDEPTLVVVPDAMKLAYGDYALIARSMLRLCSEMKDRFAILDVWSGDQKPDASVQVSTNPVMTNSVTDANREAWIGDLKYGAAYYPFLKTSLNYYFNLNNAQAPSNVIVTYRGTRQDVCDFRSSNNRLYTFVEKALPNIFRILPPSGAVAGVYANVDKLRGVWKAPANVALNHVKEPAIILDSRTQESLYQDSNAGKSINDIRFFIGKGTLIWGARTLAGNDNEWRYVSVRRFFNMVEESVKKSTAWAVFEPNDANTWVKLRAMIDNYLALKWRAGALQGTKPEEAFFVKCGLGSTMTALDILEGRMNVEIGMAVVRPAEFIIMKFAHKMQAA
jgi:phage tail sheath protein FI